MYRRGRATGRPEGAAGRAAEQTGHRPEASSPLIGVTKHNQDHRLLRPFWAIGGRCSFDRMKPHLIYIRELCSAQKLRIFAADLLGPKTATFPSANLCQASVLDLGPKTAVFPHASGEKKHRVSRIIWDRARLYRASSLKKRTLIPKLVLCE